MQERGTSISKKGALREILKSSSQREEIIVGALVSSKVEYPPGPSTNNLFPTFHRDPIKTLSDIAQTYGDISYFKFGRQHHVYFINNPMYIEQVLLDSPRNFIKLRGLRKGQSLSKGLFGNGIMFSQGAFHDRQRRLIQSSFYPERVKKYGKVAVNYAMQLCQGWEVGSTLDIHKEMMYVTLAILCRSVLGTEISRGDHDAIGNAILTSLEYYQRHQTPLRNIVDKIPVLPGNIRFREALNKLNSKVYKIIRQYRQELDNDDSKNLEREGSDENKEGNLLRSLIQSQSSQIKVSVDRGTSNKQTTDRQLRDEIMTIMVAGHDPVANALTWTFYLVSQHPEIEFQLDKELKSIMRKDGEIIPSVEDIPKLQYTEKIFRESLRLYPPAWIINRKAINDCTIGRYTISAGSTIIMSPYVMHRNPQYFNEPNTFDPGRWTQEFRAQLPKFCYYPFGGGIRSCIGEPFTWMEAILLIATISSKWKMTHAPDHIVEFYRPIITLRPKYGMSMKLERKLKQV